MIRRHKKNVILTVSSVLYNSDKNLVCTQQKAHCASIFHYNPYTAKIEVQGDLIQIDRAFQQKDICQKIWTVHIAYSNFQK